MPKEGTEKIRAVEIEAELRSVRTMADGTVNVTLNLPEGCMDQVKIMLDWLHLQVRGVLERE